MILDAKTGAYVNHYKIVKQDWHDADVSGSPVISTTSSGLHLMALAPKDGHLYGIDLDRKATLYRMPATTIEHADTPFNTHASTHFCPGSTGGAEWNSPAYDPDTNLVIVGEVDWCYSVKLLSNEKTEAVKVGQPWYGMDYVNPYHFSGVQDAPFKHWGGWVYATDADTGVWKWRAKLNYPVLSGMTPTAGGLIFFGDAGGNLYALDSATGRALWKRKLDGAIGGGVITYTANGSQRVAVAAGFESILWPTQVATGKVVVLGLPR